MDYYNSGYYDTGYYDTSAVDTANSIMGGVVLVSGITLLISAAISVLMLVSMWKVFKKCGKPGWASLIPIYNTYIMCEIAGKEWWYLLLFLVPFANIYAMFVIYDGIAKKLGKSTGFTIGLMLLPVIFWPILAFSKTDTVEEEMTTAPVQEPISQTTNTQPEAIAQPAGQTYVAPAFGATTAPVQEPATQPFEAPAAPVQEPVSQFFEAPAATVQEPVAQPFEAPAATVQEPVAQPFEAPVEPVQEPATQPFETPAAPVQEPVAQPFETPAAPVQDTAPQAYTAPTFETPVETIQESSVQSAQQIVTGQNPTSLWSNNNNNNTQM